MKRKIVTQTLGLLLSTAIVFSSIPVSAGTVPADNIATSVATSEEESVVDIFSFDWKNATKEEFNNVICDTNTTDLGIWLSCLSDEDFNTVIAMDTDLQGTVTEVEYDVAEDGTMTPVEDAESKTVKLYEYALSKVPENPKAYVFTSSYGSYIYRVIFRGVAYNYKVEISGLTKNEGLAKEETKQTATYAFIVPEGAPEEIKFNSNPGGDNHKKDLQTYGSSGKKIYSQTAFNFTKPAGYVCGYEKLECSSSSNIYYNAGDTKLGNAFAGSSNSQAKETYSLVALVHMKDAGVGQEEDGKKIATTNAKFVFRIDPITYYMNYNGNGATAGAMGPQACVYDTAYTPAANQFKRDYTIEYDGNGGTAAKKSEVVSFAFKGWGFGNASTVSHTEATPFTNANNGNGGTFYAIWEPKGTNLPMAEKAGYTLAGWFSSATNTVVAGGAAYTPYANTRMTAQWAPNNYNIKFNTNGGNEVADVVATYDADCALPVAEKAGYDFKGWTDGVNLYTDSVKNLTSEANGTVTLGAVWEARTDTPYKVIHEVETGLDTNEFEVYETEELTGTTDTFVTPTTKDYNGKIVSANGKKYNYETPELLTDKITGDSIMTIKYTYFVKTPEIIEYTVEHYLQDKNDPTVYNLDQENSGKFKIEEGSSVTPEVITTYEGYNIPNPQTVTVAANGSTIIKYYYTIDKNALNGNDGANGGSGSNGANGGAGSNGANGGAGSNGANGGAGSNGANGGAGSNGTNGGSGSNGANGGSGSNGVNGANGSGWDTNNLKAGEVKYYTDENGNVYEFQVNPDGTLTVRKIAMSATTRDTLKIAGTITVNGIKYQISEIAPNAFKNNNTLISVEIGEGIKKIGKSAFEGCKNLKTVKMGNSVTTIGARAFMNCTSLTTVKTSKSLTTIGNKAFYNCKKLKAFTIGKYVKKIGNQAFMNCKSLKKIVIAESVENVGKKAFYNCKKLKNINIKSTKLVKVGKAAFKKCHKKLLVNIPAKKKSVYTALLKNKM